MLDFQSLQISVILGLTAFTLMLHRRRLEQARELVPATGQLVDENERRRPQTTFKPSFGHILSFDQARHPSHRLTGGPPTEAMGSVISKSQADGELGNAQMPHASLKNKDKTFMGFKVRLRHHYLTKK